jgi:hypothetical protein
MGLFRGIVNHAVGSVRGIFKCNLEFEAAALNDNYTSMLSESCETLCVRIAYLNI